MKPLPSATSRFGASMGRSNTIEEPDAAIKFRLYKMRMSGDYDSGGAYWGMGPNSEAMWHAYGDGPKFVNEMFLRANTREEAKTQVLGRFKNATFYR